MKSTAVESTTTTKSASVETTAIMESASHAATMETARYTAAMETASSEAATMETATAAHAAAVKTATAAAKATATPVAASTATSPRHRWRNQANGRNCQQRDHCLTQHDHSPSEIYRSQPGPGFGGGNYFGESLSASTSP
jgi:hypothetical protein